MMMGRDLADERRRRLVIRATHAHSDNSPLFGRCLARLRVRWQILAERLPPLEARCHTGPALASDPHTLETWLCRVACERRDGQARIGPKVSRSGRTPGASAVLSLGRWELLTRRSRETKEGVPQIAGLEGEK